MPDHFRDSEANGMSEHTHDLVECRKYDETMVAVNIGTEYLGYQAAGVHRRGKSLYRLAYANMPRRLDTYRDGLECIRCGLFIPDGKHDEATA